MTKDTLIQHINSPIDFDKIIIQANVLNKIREYMVDEIKPRWGENKEMDFLFEEMGRTIDSLLSEAD